MWSTQQTEEMQTLQINGKSGSPTFREFRERLEKKLNFDNYKEKFSMLLHVEELQMLKDIRNYDMKGVVFKQERGDRRFLILEVSLWILMAFLSITKFFFSSLRQSSCQKLRRWCEKCAAIIPLPNNNQSIGGGRPKDAENVNRGGRLPSTSSTQFNNRFFACKVVIRFMMLSPSSPLDKSTVTRLHI